MFRVSTLLSLWFCIRWEYVCTFIRSIHVFLSFLLHRAFWLLNDWFFNFCCCWHLSTIKSLEQQNISNETNCLAFDPWAHSIVYDVYILQKMKYHQNQGLYWKIKVLQRRKKNRQNSNQKLSWNANSSHLWVEKKNFSKYNSFSQSRFIYTPMMLFHVKWLQKYHFFLSAFYLLFVVWQKNNQLHFQEWDSS